MLHVALSSEENLYSVCGSECAQRFVEVVDCARTHVMMLSSKRVLYHTVGSVGQGNENNFAYYASVGGPTRHTVSVCLSALVLKDGEESAGGKCNIDKTART